LKIITASENAEQEGFSFTAGGNVKSCSHSGREFVPYKSKQSFTIQLWNHSPEYLPNWFEIYVHTKTCMWMFTVAFFIMATKISFNKWGDEQTVAHPYNRVLLTDKK